MRKRKRESECARERERGEREQAVVAANTYIFLSAENPNQVKKEKKSQSDVRNINNGEARASVCDRINLVSNGVITTSKEITCIKNGPSVTKIWENVTLIFSCRLNKERQSGPGSNQI